MIGARTLRDLTRSVIPARVTFVLAVLAVCAALGLHLAATVLGMLEPRLAGKLHQIATTIEAMPLWVLIGAAMSQLASRLVRAWDDLIAWRSATPSEAERIAAETLLRDATDGLPVDLAALERARGEMEPARRHGIGRGGDA